mgnify:CR=1 FL=1
MARLKDIYNSEIKEAMQKKFNYKNVNEIPKLEKIVIIVRRRMIRVCLTLLVELHELMNRRIRQSNRADSGASGHNKKSRRSHDEPPKVDGERIYNQDRGLRSRRW